MFCGNVRVIVASLIGGLVRPLISKPLVALSFFPTSVQSFPPVTSSCSGLNSIMSLCGTSVIRSPCSRKNSFQ
uniref:Putative secreted protein n=1 Tax=Anopheles darlingi TaxID=43151 RepID=A0A2M4DNS9_ANODA